MRKSVSWTTRPPRRGEEQDVDYRFVDETSFRKAAKEGAFVEWEEYRGALYGTPWSEVRRALEGDEHLVVEIDIRGAKSLKQLYPEAITVFLRPPSIEQLGERLRIRGTDSPEQIQARLDAANEELKSEHDLDYAITNEDVSETTDLLEAIIDGSFPSAAR